MIPRFSGKTRPWAAAITLALLLLAGSAAAAVANDERRITICHHPEEEARTLKVARSSWQAHEAHGDHKGPCGSVDAASTSGSGNGSGEGRGLEPAHVTPRVEANGDPDGGAVFNIFLRNDGEAAQGVELTLHMKGDGHWNIDQGLECHSGDDGTATCDIGRIDARTTLFFQLEFDGGPKVCTKPILHVSVTASNDDDADDNESSQSTHAGACALLVHG